MTITAQELVEKKIELYKPDGNLDHTARVFLALSGINHGQVKGHAERVALLTEMVATRQGLNQKAAFFAGLLHDIGKLVLPYDFFDGRDISVEEYEQVKTHAINGFLAFNGTHLLTAVCAGIHHALYHHGYGLTIDDFPKEWNLATVKLVLDIGMIISICDFIDAYNHRKTKIKDGSDQGTPTLKEMLYKKYPNEHAVIDIALEEAEEKIFS